MPLFIHNVLHGHSIQNMLRFMRLGLSDVAVTDAQINCVSIIYSGLLDDFPRLQFVVAEQGTGWIIPIGQALDAKFQAPKRNFAAEEEISNPATTALMRRAAVPPELRSRKNQRPPSEYLRQNFTFTIETEETELVDAIAYLGPERFLFATTTRTTTLAGS